MSNTNLGIVALSVPAVDLNELCLDHPGASYIFELSRDLAVVDRAAVPSDGCLVIVVGDQSFSAEMYHGQRIFGVVTHVIRRLN